jgi:indolepyruvate ferredoxin oxidoreductase
LKANSQLAAEGVKKIVVVAAEPERYADISDLAPGANPAL